MHSLASLLVLVDLVLLPFKIITFFKYFFQNSSFKLMQFEVEWEIKLLLFISIVYEKIAGVQSEETSSRKYQEMVSEIIDVMTVWQH
jgi:hypothetical protein